LIPLFFYICFMKKYFTLFVYLILFFSLKSQDIIYYTNGDEINAKVTKIGKEEISYKKFENLNGPEYSEEKKNIFMIKYENGTKDIINTINDNNTETDKEDLSNFYAGKEISYYDGVPIISYSESDCVIAMSLRKGRQYGKYYIAEIVIFNSSGNTIDFIPEYAFYPLFINQGIVTTGNVMSYDEYNKKVKNMQAWRSFGIGLANAMSAYNAGYSTSTTNSSAYGYGSSNTNTSVYGYGSGGWANVYGNSTTNASFNAYGSSTTTTYDGGAAYLANQNAGRNMANFEAYQKIERNRIQYEYLKRHTLKSGEEISGKLNIPYKEAEIVEINLLFNGKEYLFQFTQDLILTLEK